VHEATALRVAVCAAGEAAVALLASMLRGEGFRRQGLKEAEESAKSVQGRGGREGGRLFQSTRDQTAQRKQKSAIRMMDGRQAWLGALLPPDGSSYNRSQTLLGALLPPETARVLPSGRSVPVALSWYYKVPLLRISAFIRQGLSRTAKSS
jgi:hypothetical protein